MQAYFDMLVATSSNLVIQLADDAKHDMNAYMSLLAHTAACSPPLRGLSIYTAVHSPSTAGLLADALLHHCSICSLSLPYLPCIGNTENPAANIVLHALPRLSHLTCLKLTLLTPTFPDEQTATSMASAHSTRSVLQALAAAVGALVHLTDLELCTMHAAEQLPQTGDDSAEASPHKIRKLAIEEASCRLLGGVPTLDPVVAALSTAPALTQLSLSFTYPHNTTGLPFSGIRGPFNALRNLILGTCFLFNGLSWHPTAAGTLLPPSPLPALTALSFHSGSSSREVSHIADVLDGASHQSALRCMELHMRAVPDAALPPLGARLGLLSMLHTVSLFFGDKSRASQRGVRALAEGLAQLTSLTSLLLSFEHACPERAAEVGVTAAAVPDDSSAMLRPLSSLPRLQHMCFSCDVDCTVPIPGLNRALLDCPLHALCQLTHLDMNFNFNEVEVASVRHHVPTLTQLQHLNAAGLRCNDAEDVRASLAPLTQLTYLRLSIMPVDAALVRCIGECASLMHGLQECCVRSCDLRCDDEDVCEFAHADWLQGLVYLPGWGRYEFHVSNDAVPDCVLRAVARQLESRGAAVTPSCCTVSF